MARTAQLPGSSQVLCRRQRWKLRLDIARLCRTLLTRQRSSLFCPTGLVMRGRFRGSIMFRSALRRRRMLSIMSRSMNCCGNLWRAITTWRKLETCEVECDCGKREIRKLTICTTEICATPLSVMPHAFPDSRRVPGTHGKHVARIGLCSAMRRVSLIR